jgi:hypothetical protein
MFHAKRPLSWYWHPLTSNSEEAKNQNPNIAKFLKTLFGEHAFQDN